MVIKDKKKKVINNIFKPSLLHNKILHICKFTNIITFLKPSKLQAISRLFKKLIHNKINQSNMGLHYHTIYKFHTIYSSWVQSATIPLLNHACGKVSLKHSILFPNISSNKCYFTTPSTKMSFIASCQASHPQRLHFQNMLCSGIP